MAANCSTENVAEKTITVKGLVDVRSITVGLVWFEVGN